MTPDIDELIKKVNTLTLDKSRLKQKLNQLTQSSNNNQQTHSISADSNISLLHQLSLSSQSSSNYDKSQPQQQVSSSLVATSETYDVFRKNHGGETTIANINHKSVSTPAASGNSLNSIAGVDCSTSCEEDLLFMNEFYRKRLDEYNENWDYIQSKCTALLSELSALQKHYSLLKQEKVDLEEKLKSTCDESDKIKSELQTVVLNYETQLSAMSEHLSMITSQVSLDDKI